jgi:hypothetical protein
MKVLKVLVDVSLILFMFQGTVAYSGENAVFSNERFV